MVLIGMVAVGGSALAVSPADKCEADKLKTAGKYAYCRLKAESDALKRGTTPDYTSCDSKYGTKWSQAEAQSNGMCPVAGDHASIQAEVTLCTTQLASAIGGNATSPLCGNGIIDTNEDCDQSNLNGQTCVTRGYTSGTLACSSGCTFDTSGCSSSRFIDNGDGTVTDTQTGLQWEKKDDNNGVRDKDNGYSLTVSGSAPDGQAFTVFLAELNDASTHCGCFAGHCDWRLPTFDELQSILLAPFPCPTNPCIDPIFGPVGPAVLSIYWSYDGVASYSNYLSFQDGNSGMFIGTVGFYVRAVRTLP